MRHAGQEALDRLEALLAEVRALPGVRETARGVFYVKGRAWLHFHEDPVGLFADLRAPGEADFTRRRVATDDERTALLGLLREQLAG